MPRLTKALVGTTAVAGGVSTVVATIATPLAGAGLAAWGAYNLVAGSSVAGGIVLGAVGAVLGGIAGVIAAPFVAVGGVLLTTAAAVGIAAGGAALRSLLPFKRGSAPSSSRSETKFTETVILDDGTEVTTRRVQRSKGFNASATPAEAREITTPDGTVVIEKPTPRGPRI